MISLKVVPSIDIFSNKKFTDNQLKKLRELKGVERVGASEFKCILVLDDSVDVDEVIASVELMFAP